MATEEPPIEERLLRLVERELGAEQVTLQRTSGEPPSDDAHWVAVALPDNRTVSARFASPPEDRAAIERRMQILVSAFSHLLDQQRPEPEPRAPIAHSLTGELSALAKRARAIEAFVIDAHSPVIWGSAHGLPELSRTSAVSSENAETIRLVDLSRHELFSIANDEPTSTVRPPTLRPAADPEEQPSQPALVLCERAIRELKRLDAFARLRRGQPLAQRTRREGFGYLAHSFAAIYVLVLVFDGVFDELRAERCVHESIERIERLVLALPPRDPSPNPTADVVRVPRRRR